MKTIKYGESDRRFQFPVREQLSLELIPPLAAEFWVYGNEGTLERAREWALLHHYLLARGVPACAHGLYLLEDCPSDCASLPFLDHANLWVPYDPVAEAPFILSAPYVDEVGRDAHVYGRAHGIEVGESEHFGEDWYGYSTLPIRFQARNNVLWPIVQKAIILTRTFPVTWPEPEEAAWPK